MSKYKLNKILPLAFFLLTIAVAAFWMSEARATGKKKPPQTLEQSQRQTQGQHQGQEVHNDVAARSVSDSVSSSESVSSAVSDSVSDAAAASSSSNDGNSLSVNSEAGPADLVLVPNNNTERCLRVFGFSFGNQEGSGMLGVPWRSGQCDYMSYASEAAAYGDHDLAWFWRCHMKTAYKTFRDKGETKESAIEDCITKNSGANYLVEKANKQKEQIRILTQQRDAGLLIIEERDKEALRLKEEVAEKRLVEAVSK